MKPPFLAYDVSTCRNCGEPILRPVTRQDADVLLRWLHTPERLNCLNAWREVTGREADPTWRVVDAEQNPARRPVGSHR